MKKVFADTYFWVAMVDPHQPHHARAKTIRSELTARFVTTDEVIVEFLNFLSGRGIHLRTMAVAMARRILNDTSIVVFPQTHESMLDGLRPSNKMGLHRV